jgi:Na+/proline symporter
MREIIIGLVFVAIITGVVFWFTRHEPEAILKIMIAVVAIFIGAGAYIWNLVKKRKNLETGSPAEDEFTQLSNLHAGSKAFQFSMYLWLFIFIFNNKFTNNEEMIGIGILGSALIYGISLFYYRSTAGFNEK